MGKPAGGNTQIAFGAWLPMLNPHGIRVGVSIVFFYNYGVKFVTYLAEFCICVPLIPK